MKAIVAHLLSGSSLEAVGLAALLMTLAGVWLQWNRPAHVADIEEALKDGRLLPDEAEQRLRAVSRRATGWVLAGMALLVFVAITWVKNR
ncbi:hypothetical protein [Opitutus terrae]|uniref:Uncharacterized protein n=1 Tax=Opitutus terrae (strain DSM 11246 / JCM 15787 / PB90-1) TaxID=452637 RepID=B1ZTG6_OPITP|nr:hypothetical protein [Opitutus terrae]ACB73911.1 hypothetical protein Oter_0621 [Opitutus terrae PB90-1]